jgi:16S rRNA (guanine966-N2)-methyltransferase
VRVVAGHLRGRRLYSPEGNVTRPTTDRVREAVFNALASLGSVPGAQVVDLYAGTGALGIEALSRGAEHCRFVEHDAGALRALRANLSELGLDDRSTVIRGDALTYARTMAPCDLLLVDPPYGFGDWAELLGEPTGDTTGEPLAHLVVAEAGAPFDAPPGWESVRAKRYGRTFVAFLEPVEPLPYGLR